MSLEPRTRKRFALLSFRKGSSRCAEPPMFTRPLLGCLACRATPPTESHDVALGDKQVSDKERKLEYENLFKDIASILVDKCINPETGKPFTLSMLERALRDVHFNVDPKRSAKQQALEVHSSALPARFAGRDSVGACIGNRGSGQEGLAPHCLTRGLLSEQTLPETHRDTGAGGGGGGGSSGGQVYKIPGLHQMHGGNRQSRIPLAP